tara:strand:+ start:1756 stop:2736 length:981 start_codon:yes stop_codon:yes gene_type:complete
MAQNRTNSDAFVEAQRYDEFILSNLHDGMIPDNMTRDVGSFGTGTTLNVKSVGTVTLQDVAEGVPMVYNPIDNSSVTLTITEYSGDAWAISDELRQDGSQIDQLHAARAQESTRALQEKFESDFLAVCNTAQTNDGLNAINGFKHRMIGSATSRAMVEADLIEMALAFDKANVPAAGRIGIVDPIVAATFNKLVTVTLNADMNSGFYGMWTDSFVENHRFVARIHGWDLFTSNRLPLIATATAGTLVQGDGTADNAEIGDVANVFMSIVDDNVKPIMKAWRKMPSTEGWRANEDREDRFQVTSRYGIGAQRVDTLGVIVTSPTASA